MKTEQFIPFWSEGKHSFLKDPPNAALSFVDHEHMEDVVVTLHDPVLKGEDLTYRVDVIDGEIPAKSEHVSLFIDVVVMPLKPVTSCGVRRRTPIRAVAVSR